MKTKLSKLKNRLYADYFMPSKLNEYDQIIKDMINKNYKFITFREYCKLLEDNMLGNEKYFINRHDIDTDISTAKEFFKIEKNYGVKATYYFRLSTLDIKFMKEIEEYGSEASYHFEEIAQFAKDNHLKSKEEIFKRFDEIKEKFKENFNIIENKIGVKLSTICSHGDFVNRKLNIINNELTKDKQLRKELGIVCETYDENIINNLDLYLSDGKFPLTDKAKDIVNYCNEKSMICMLTHPRQWRSNGWENTKENFKRIIEEIKW